VILVDVNILIYATDRRSPQHAVARDWLDAQLTDSVALGMPWVSLLGFLRLSTNPRIMPRPLSIAAAWEEVTAWLTCEAVWIPQPTERHSDILGELLALPGVHGNLVTDAHLAALAIEHGLTLCSTDGDFARFPGLSWRNPLAL
jgi:toxin-antitoxin system PIN domain toxin